MFQTFRFYNLLRKPGPILNELDHRALRLGMSLNLVERLFRDALRLRHFDPTLRCREQRNPVSMTYLKVCTRVGPLRLTNQTQNPDQNDRINRM